MSLSKPAPGGTAGGGGLDRTTSRGPCQPQPTYHSEKSTVQNEEKKNKTTHQNSRNWFEVSSPDLDFLWSQKKKKASTDKNCSV